MRSQGPVPPAQRQQAASGATTSGDAIRMLSMIRSRGCMTRWHLPPALGEGCFLPTVSTGANEYLSRAQKNKQGESARLLSSALTLLPFLNTELLPLRLAPLVPEIR